MEECDEEEDYFCDYGVGEYELDGDDVVFLDGDVEEELVDVDFVGYY